MNTNIISVLNSPYFTGSCSSFAALRRLIESVEVSSRRGSFLIITETTDGSLRLCQAIIDDTSSSIRTFIFSEERAELFAERKIESDTGTDLRILNFSTEQIASELSRKKLMPLSIRP